MLIRIIAAMTLVSATLVAPVAAQEGPAPEVTTYDYWETETYPEETTVGGTARTWVGAQDGALGDYPTPESAPGILQVRFLDDEEATCEVGIMFTLQAYFETFEFLELTVGEERFDLEFVQDQRETPETLLRIRADEIVAALDAFGPAITTRLTVTDWEGEPVFEETFPLIGFTAATTAAGANCGETVDD
jgi:hypothetical protein